MTSQLPPSRGSILIGQWLSPLAPVSAGGAHLPRRAAAARPPAAPGQGRFTKTGTDAVWNSNACNGIAWFEDCIFLEPGLDAPPLSPCSA